MKRFYYRIFVVILENYFASFTSIQLNGRAINSDNLVAMKLSFGSNSTFSHSCYNTNLVVPIAEMLKRQDNNFKHLIGVKMIFYF